MKAFMIFAVVLTIGYVVYYTVVIVHDLYGKPKEKKADAETFDVSDMEDDDESVNVSENDGGFSVGGNEYETTYEAMPAVDEKTEEPKGEKVDIAEKIQAGMEAKLENTNTAFSDPMYEEELCRTMLAKGLRGNRVAVKVTTVKDEL